MKKVLLLLILLNSSFLFAQSEWAPKGAIWHYNYPSETGIQYTTIESVGDTIIHGIECKILQTSLNLDPVRVYSYYNDGIVWVTKKGPFHKLYDFNANIGDTWQVIDVFGRCQTDSLATVIVDRIGDTTINNIQLSYIVVRFLTSARWGFECYGTSGTSYKIIENIGALGYMFPQSFCAIDFPYPCSLRCYSDSKLGTFETGIADSCNLTVTEINENLLKKSIAIYPNPIKDELNIDLLNSNYCAFLTIYNLFGMPVLKKIIYGSMSSVNLNELTSGYYILRIDQNNKTSFNKIIKL